MLRFMFSSFFLVAALCGQSKIIYDSPDEVIHRLFEEARTKYVIRYSHYFTDTLKVPVGCELYFDGGSLSGPVVFAGTKLNGRVNLRGSSLRGSIRNKLFEAYWLCYMDGETDDARCVNDMIRLCDRIHFSKGKYRLRSKFDSEGVVDKTLYSQIQTHIGINRSNVWLVGDEDAEFITDVPLGTVFVFSKPNDIENSIRNIVISGLTFTVHNDGKDFHEYMHTIKLIGVNGITIKNCRFNDFWGDAICLSHYGDTRSTGERTRNMNVKILNNEIIGGEKHSNRNGISVINGKNVLIKYNTIKNTSRKDMPGGVDIEPNNSAYTIDNIIIEKNTFEGVWGTAGAVGIVLLRDQAPAYNLRVIKNTIRNSSCGISFAINTEMSSGNIEIRKNVISGDTHPYNFIGNGSSRDWVISENYFERSCLQNMPGNIRVENLVIENNKKKD